MIFIILFHNVSIGTVKLNAVITAFDFLFVWVFFLNLF